MLIDASGQPANPGNNAEDAEIKAIEQMGGD